MAGLWQVYSEAERLQRLVLSAGVVILLTVFTVFGIAKSNDSAQKVFWAAIQNSMNANAVTVGTSVTDTGITEKTLSQLDFGPRPSSRVLTTLDNDGATAVTETLATTTSEYTRYVNIHKVFKNKPINFTSVLGVWAKTANYKGDIVPPTFSQVLLGEPLPMPIGKLTSHERALLLAQIQANQIYTVDFSSAKRTTYNGRTAYVYKVSTQPVLYLELLKSYGPYLGMGGLSQVNPNQYDAQPDIQSTWTIDAKSKQLVKADFGNGHVETYSGWNIPVTTLVPTHTVTALQLQERLNKILQ